MGSLIMLVPFANTNLFPNVMAQSYDTYSDSYYSTYPTDDKKYECRTGPFEGFFVSSVEFCKKVKFDKDESKRDSNITGTQGPPGSGNNNSTLVNTFNCINPNVININTETNLSSSSSFSGLQPILDEVAQGLNATSNGLSQINLNKTIVNICFINDNDNIVIEGGNATDGNNDNGTQNCEECFVELFDQATIELIETNFGFVSLGQLCIALSTGEISESTFRSGLLELLGSDPDDIPVVASLIECLRDFGVFNP